MEGQKKTGDISVTPFPGGYLVGRMMDQARDGKLWEYIGASSGLQDALLTACKNADGHSVWSHSNDDSYEAIDCSKITN